MTADNPYQNLDIGARNPFAPIDPEPTIDPQDKPKSSPKSNKSFQMPSDPKLKLLIILGVTIAVLSLLSLIVTVVRKSQLQPTVRPTATPAPTHPPEATPTPDVSIPIEITDKFNKIDRNTQVIIDFQPPQIDPDIGL